MRSLTRCRKDIWWNSILFVIKTYNNLEIENNFSKKNAKSTVNIILNGEIFLKCQRQGKLNINTTCTYFCTEDPSYVYYIRKN